MSAAKPIDRNNPHYKIGFLWGALIVARSALVDARANIDGRGRHVICKDVDFAISLASHALVETEAPGST